MPSGHLTVHGNWRRALRALTGSRDAAVEWLERRYEFTSEVARQLVAPLHPHAAVVYAVWLDGEHDRPVYIGESMQPDRRLRDLPIGESHHLSNSFPPEIWRAVGVVDWAQALRVQPALEAELLAQCAAAGFGDSNPLKAIGLGVEFYLQRSLEPLFNVRSKLRDGGWRPKTFERSGSAGALCARLPALVRFATQVESVLVQLPFQQGHAAGGSTAWCVFPSEIARATASHLEPNA